MFCLITAKRRKVRYSWTRTYPFFCWAIILHDGHMAIHFCEQTKNQKYCTPWNPRSSNYDPDREKIKYFVAFMGRFASFFESCLWWTVTKTIILKPGGPWVSRSTVIWRWSLLHQIFTSYIYLFDHIICDVSVTQTQKDFFHFTLFS